MTSSSSSSKQYAIINLGYNVRLSLKAACQRGQSPLPPSQLKDNAVEALEFHLGKERDLL